MFRKLSTKREKNEILLWRNLHNLPIHVQENSSQRKTWLLNIQENAEKKMGKGSDNREKCAQILELFIWAFLICCFFLIPMHLMSFLKTGLQLWLIWTLNFQWFICSFHWCGCIRNSWVVIAKSFRFSMHHSTSQLPIYPKCERDWIAFHLS